MAPLTLIFGRNNSGKSSLLQSLLLLRQSLGAPLYGPCLNLAGPLYAAGSYSDIIHLHETKRRLSFELSLKLANGQPAHIRLSFTNDEPRPPRLASLGVSGGDLLGLGIHRSKGKGGPFEPVSYTHLDVYKRQILMCSKLLIIIEWSQHRKLKSKKEEDCKMMLKTCA